MNDDSKGYAVGVGDALRDAPEPPSPIAEYLEGKAEGEAPDIEDPNLHLCSTCIHARVCVVAVAAQPLRAEGLFTISACGAYDDATADLDHLDDAEDNSLYPEIPK